MPASGAKGAGRLTDPVLAGALALVVCALHGFDGPLGHDQGAFVYGGERFAHGVPPYVGIFNSIGPMVDVVTGTGVWLGSVVSVHGVLAARVTYLVVSALAVALLSVLAREALQSRAAGLVAPAIMLTFEQYVFLASDGPRDKTVMVLLLEASLLMLVRRRWLWAGLFVALGTLTWQPVVLPLAAAALLAIRTERTGRTRAALDWLFGGVAPTIGVAVLYALLGHLRVAWWGFVLVNVGYTSQPNIVQSWGLLNHSYGRSLALVLLGLAALLAVGAVAVPELRRPDPPDRSRNVVLLAAGGLVAAAWTCYAVNGGPDLFVVLPFAALGIAALVGLLAGRLSELGHLRVAAPVAAVALVLAATQSVTTRDGRLTDERAEIVRTVSALPQGATVLSIDTPEIPAILERRNPYPWQLFNSSMTPFLDDHLHGGLAGLSARIGRARPALIAVGDAATDDWIKPLLRSDYSEIGDGLYWTWFARRDLAPSVLSGLRRAAR